MVRYKQTLHEIRIEDISQIKILPFRGYKWVGLGVGVVIDVIVLSNIQINLINPNFSF